MRTSSPRCAARRRTTSRCRRRSRAASIISKRRSRAAARAGRRRAGEDRLRRVAAAAAAARRARVAAAAVRHGVVVTHERMVRADRTRLIGCYHPSRQNTNTGKLTPAMMERVFRKARSDVVGASVCVAPTVDLLVDSAGLELEAGLRVAFAVQPVALLAGIAVRCRQPSAPPSRRPSPPQPPRRQSPCVADAASFTASSFFWAAQNFSMSAKAARGRLRRGNSISSNAGLERLLQFAVRLHRRLHLRRIVRGCERSLRLQPVACADHQPQHQNSTETSHTESLPHNRSIVTVCPCPPRRWGAAGL